MYVPFSPGSAKSSTSLAIAYVGNPVYNDIDSLSSSNVSNDGGSVSSFKDRTSARRSWISSSIEKSTILEPAENVRDRPLEAVFSPSDVSERERDVRPQPSSAYNKKIIFRKFFVQNLNTCFVPMKWYSTFSQYRFSF